MAKAKTREWTPEAEKVPKAQPSPPSKPEVTEKLLLGKRVTVHFLDGASLTGTFTSVHKYTFVLEHEGQSLLVYKHAVKLIEEAP